MNREMWAHPATQRNLAQLDADGARVLGVGNGWQACGETGDGRMLEPPSSCSRTSWPTSSPSCWPGQHVVVTAGPTFEALDPIRGITNHSSGKMGFAIARAAREAGAEVTLVAGPVHLPTPRGVRAHRRAVGAARCSKPPLAAAQAATVFVATAAVADWRPATHSEQKIKKDGSGQRAGAAFRREPRHPADASRRASARRAASCSASASPPRARTWSRMPRPSASARAFRCWWATSAR